MNLKTIAILALFNGFFLLSLAQISNFKVLVTDDTRKPVEAANIGLHLSRDSSIIQQAQADDKGVFQFTRVADGTYFITASSVGFLNKKGLNFTIAKGISPFDTLKIILVHSDKILNAVTVTGHKPLIETRLDKTVVNVDAFLSNAGSSLLEVLGNSPNVDVDINGSINVKGRPGVLVFIDGKQNYLGGTDLINYLNGIPASQVDQIEIMTHPSARYDAAGNSGVINIKMKKNSQVGFNSIFSASYMQGPYPRTLNSELLNYKRGNWNFFSNISFDYIKRHTRRAWSRNIHDTASNLNVQYNQDENDIVETPTHSILVGFDYAPPKKWQVGFVAGNRGSGQENQLTDISTFNDLNNHSKIMSSLHSYNVINNPWINNSVGISLKKNISEKKTWSADFNYENFQFNSHQQSSNYSYDSLGNVTTMSLNPYIQKVILPSTIEILSAKCDYSYSLKNTTLETGVKMSFTRSTNNASFYFFENNIFQQDLNLTNFYNYRENINAVYLNLHRQLKKWSWQAGLRVEETNSLGKQNTSNQKFNKSYIQVFPTLYISYAPDEKHGFGFSYGRRIDRPNYLDLNPFLYLLDQYTYRKGNPDLKPFFSNQLELDYNFKRNFHADLDYGKETGVIDNLFTQNDSTRILIQSFANLNSLSTIALNVSYDLAIKKWSTIVFSYSLYNNRFQGQKNGTKIDNRITTNLINYTQQFRFGKGWSSELNIVYRSPILLSSITRRGPRKISSVGIGKEILKRNGSLKLRITDPLNIQQGYGSTDFGNVHTTIRFREDSRRIGITFTYRFQKGAKSNGHKLYSPEEKNRINVGQ
jgi:hypothetical protein